MLKLEAVAEAYGRLVRSPPKWCPACDHVNRAAAGRCYLCGGRVCDVCRDHEVVMPYYELDTDADGNAVVAQRASGWHWSTKAGVAVLAVLVAGVVLCVWMLTPEVPK